MAGTSTDIGTEVTDTGTGINFFKRGNFFAPLFLFSIPLLYPPPLKNLPHLNPPPPLEGEDTEGGRNFLKRKLFYGKIKH